MRKNYFVAAALLLVSFSSFGQTYATEELRLREEAHLAEKGGAEQDQPALFIENTSELPPFSYEGTENFFKIEKIEIVNVGLQHSEEEKQQFAIEALSEFELNDFLLDLENGKFYIVNRSNENFKVFEYTLMENSFRFNCSTCNLPDALVVLMNEHQVVVDFPNQDEAEVFVFRYTFKK